MIFLKFAQIILKLIKQKVKNKMILRSILQSCNWELWYNPIFEL